LAQACTSVLVVRQALGGDAGAALDQLEGQQGPGGFVTVPAEQSLHLRQVSRDVTYGWGCSRDLVTVRLTLGGARA
jgi:hypothetical protein